MRIYIGFDDTDTLGADRGTGKLARWFEQELPDGCRLWGVVRQQLLLDPAIPYTSHNSSACAVVEAGDPHGALRPHPPGGEARGTVLAPRERPRTLHCLRGEASPRSLSDFREGSIPGTGDGPLMRS